ncbi:MAG: HD domain-containing protein, partial [Nitrososphaerota archaeon]
MKLERIIEAIHRLKETKRTGWLERGVKDPESVASHSYGVAVLTLLIAHEKGLDTLNAVATALLHDLA